MSKDAGSSTAANATHQSGSGMSIAHGFFSSRNSMFQRAVDDSQSILDREENGTFIGSWLLTMWVIVIESNNFINLEMILLTNNRHNYYEKYSKCVFI